MAVELPDVLIGRTSTFKTCFVIGQESRVRASICSFTTDGNCSSFKSLGSGSGVEVWFEMKRTYRSSSDSHTQVFPVLDA